MRSGLWGLAMLSGLVVCSSNPVFSNDKSPEIRFVGPPEFLKTIDPARAARRPVRMAQKPRRMTPPLPVSRPRKAVAADSSWPITLDEVRARAKAAKDKAEGKVDRWPQGVIITARARCVDILKRIGAVAVYEEPIKQGECGTPAPIRLISIGRKPEVVISPPALINCEMAEALHTWLKNELQPLARKHLGGPIIKISKMSDYSCRNAYGRARGRLSEHGRANALDIAGFSTARGDAAMLLADWGQTKRDIRRQVAAAKAKALAEEKKKIAAGKRAQELARNQKQETGQTARMATNKRNNEIETGSLSSGIRESNDASSVNGIPGLTVTTPIAEPDQARAGSFEIAPSRLGGPKPHNWDHPGRNAVQTAAAKGGAAVKVISRQRFLRGAHKSACRIFGTVLGPEANNAHRNHFHIDLAKRKSGAFCQ
ncbi:MAG: extensin family protein [Hyphomicrobiaceae bacterium]